MNRDASADADKAFEFYRRLLDKGMANTDALALTNNYVNMLGIIGNQQRESLADVFRTKGAKS